MSLSPTPPRPVQRDDEKENLVLTPKKSIGWSTTKEIFEISPSAFQSTKTSSPYRKPRKSILKPARPLQPFHPEKKRDFTPMPDDALSDKSFLQYPVSIITANTSSLRDLTEAYNILASRIRTSVPTEFWQQPVPDLQCPLFHPLRSNADALATSIKRDLGRIFADPMQADEDSISTRLPTPRSSPKKKSPSKGGMTEEQVKLARDLTTVTASVIKLLILVFQAPSLYSAFSQKQLHTILTGVLAIPLADSIRSPSARKICGFAIQLLQSQRLPDEVLTSGRDRILFALKRAMEGELGREGKKGSASEAFKAVHDLCLYRPSIFVPGMEHYISSVLDGLLAPSCVLRVQAAHALGGLSMAIARSGIEFDNFLRDVSPTVVEFFLRNDSDAGKHQPTILKTLRTTLRTSDPVHHAQGPLWAISVLASLTVLLGPALLRNYELLTTYRDVVCISFKSKKLIFRSAIAMLWGPLIWTWKKWRNTPDISRLDGEEPDELEVVKEEFSQLLMRMNHTPVGILLYGTLLGHSDETCSPMDLLHVFVQLADTVRRYKGDLTSAVLAVLERLLNTREDDEFHAKWEERCQMRLIPQQLFSVSPGLLTAEMNTNVLGTMIENIVTQMSRIDEMRPLSIKEKRSRPVFTKALDVWNACLEQLQLAENEVIPDVFVDTWSGIIRMGLLDREDQRAVILFAEQTSGHLSSIFFNKAVDMRDPENSKKKVVLGDPITSPDNVVFKFALVRSLWSALVGIFPSYAHGSAAKTLVRFLVEKRDMFVQNICDDASEKDKEALSEWAQLVAQVVAVSSIGFTKQFWSIEFGWDDRSLARVWRGYVRGWTDEGRGSWEGAMVLLGRPFNDDSPWDMSDADLSAWNSLLAYANEDAAGYLSHAEFLERLVQHIDRRHIVTLSSVVRVADYLLSSFLRTIERCTALPSKFIELIHDILSTSYPPPPRNKIVAIWLLRSLVSVISNCPSELVVELLENILEGLVTWISDDCRLFTSEEYTSEIIPLYETIIVSLQSLPPTTEVMQSLSMLIASALQVEEYTGTIKPEREEALTSFTEFWSTSCRHLQEPRGGWAEGIDHALHLAFPVEATSIPDYDEQDSEDELDILPNTTITPQRRLVQKLPPSPSPVRFHPVRKTTLSSTSCRPSAKRARLSEPAYARTLFIDSPPSPTVHKSKRNSMAVPSVFSRSEKENVQPRYAGYPGEDVGKEVTFVGIMRRTPLKKSTPTPKRARTFTGGSDDSEDARAVEEVIQVVHSPVRRPFSAATSRANTNLVGQVTPTKRGAIAGMGVESCPRLMATSSLSSQRSYGRKPNSSSAALGSGRIVSAGSKRHRDQLADDDSDDEDEWLPPSSDPESEDEDENDEDADMEQAPDLVEDLGSSSSNPSSSSSSSSPIRTPNHARYSHAGRRSLPYGAHDLRIHIESDDDEQQHMAGGSPFSKRHTNMTVAYPPFASLPHSKRAAASPAAIVSVPAFTPLSPLI